MKLNHARVLTDPETERASFTIKYDGRARELISKVKVCAGFDPAKLQEAPGPYETVYALWDTGANVSSISRGIAESLGLTPQGEVEVSSVQGKAMCRAYVVNFVLADDVSIHSLRVTEYLDPYGRIDAVIGMDVIAFGDFCISNPGGNTWFTFRLPSRGATDYFEEQHGEARNEGGRLWIPEAPGLM